MNRRIAYIVSGYDQWPQVFPGGIRKVQGQIKAFERAGFSVDLIVPKIDRGILAKISRRMPFCSDMVAWPDLDAEDYSCFYVRRPLFVSKEFLSFLKRAKARNEDLRILYEIPTYPYDAEDKTLRMFQMHLRDLVNRGKLCQVVDRVVDLSGHQEIFGIPTVPMINGIDLDAIEPRRPSFDGKAMSILCVANFAKWHGVDRLIRGLHEYYSRSDNARSITVHLVGDGPELDHLKKMTKEFALEDRVRFYGMCDHEAIDDFYDHSAIAVASLGLHRIGATVASTLKTREYLAKGVPFIYSGEVDVFLRKPVDFCLQLAADDSSVNIEDVCSFYDAVYNNERVEEEMIVRIRQYAEKQVSVHGAMESVIRYIERDEAK